MTTRGLAGRGENLTENVLLIVTDHAKKYLRVIKTVLGLWRLSLANNGVSLASCGGPTNIFTISDDRRDNIVLSRARRLFSNAVHTRTRLNDIISFNIVSSPRVCTYTVLVVITTRV